MMHCNIACFTEFFTLSLLLYVSFLVTITLISSTFEIRSNMSTNLIDGVIFGIIISVTIVSIRTIMNGRFIFEVLLIIVVGIVLGSIQYGLDRLRKRRSSALILATPSEKQPSAIQPPPLQSPDIVWDNNNLDDVSQNLEQAIGKPPPRNHH